MRVPPLAQIAIVVEALRRQSSPMGATARGDHTSGRRAGLEADGASVHHLATGNSDVDRQLLEPRWRKGQRIITKHNDVSELPHLDAPEELFLEARIRGVEIVTSIHAVRIVIPAELISYRVKSDFHRMPAARPAHIVSPFEVRIQGQSLRVRLIGSGDACDVKRGNVMDTGSSHALNADLFQDVGADQVGVVIVAPGASCPYVFH